ncbi:MAG: zinc dependent phospholipase C family protein [Treponema sp.]|nr:zinc dependent phospholipase C family protein [Treponema sp.]
MPSQILHTLFGEDVIDGIYSRIGSRFGIVADKALKKTLFDYRKAFILGCQGPDIFYHNRRRRPVGLEYGSLLHRRGSGIFTAGLLKMGLPDPPPDEDDIRAGRREKGINALGVYALGFMTHAILDRHAHPYIVYKTGCASNDAAGAYSHVVFHLFFERILDVLMLQRRGTEISSWGQEKMLADICEKPPLGLQELLARALVLAFPERAGKDEKLRVRIENALADCANFYCITNPVKTAIADQKFPPDYAGQDKTKFIPYLYPENMYCYDGIGNKAGSGSDADYCIDFLNLQKKPWHYPIAGREEDCRSFPEIYSDAVQAAVGSMAPVITGYLETGVFPIPEAARAIGNSGLSITDENGKPCSPNLTDPLPLEKVLRQQAVLRGLQF